MSYQTSDTPREMLGQLPRLVIFAALSAFTLAAASLWQTADWSTALFRPACALTPAALLLFHRRYWPVILIIASALGAAYALLTAGPGFALLTLAIADPLAAVLIVILVQKLDGDVFDLTRLRSVAISSGIVVAVAALLSLIALFPVAPGTSNAHGWLAQAFELWSSTTLSLLLVVPFALAWLRPAALVAARPVGRIEWSLALVLPAATVQLIALAAPAHSVALAGLSVLLVMLLWGAIREQPRMMTSALLVTGALGAWHVASPGMQQAALWAQLTLPVTLVCAPIVVLFIGAALLGKATEHYLHSERLRIVSSVSRQLSTESVAAMERCIDESLREISTLLAASSIALFSRGADSALFRRIYSCNGRSDSLPEAFLARQLCDTELPGAAAIVCEAQPHNGQSPAQSTNVAVKLLDTDQSDLLLAASWTNTGNATKRDAAALFGLLLPVYRMATNQRQALSACQSANRRYAALLSTVPDAVCVSRIDGTLIEVNAGFEKLTGFSRREAVGRSCCDLKIISRSATSAVTAVARGDAATITSQTATIRNKSGVSVQCDLLAAPIDAGGEAHVLVLARDESLSTDKKRQQRDLEKQLNQAQRMEAIGQLTQGVAHDFNNILGSIVGYASLARMHRPSRDDLKLQDYLSEIEVAGERATLLIQQMLTFSRRGRTNPAPIDANSVLKRVLNVLPSLLPAGVESRLNVSQNLPQLVADSAQFEQAIISLAVNARDAITGNGTITLGSRRFKRAAAVCNSCHKSISGEAVEIYVADSGSGIAPEVMDRLFEPFFTTKEVGRGTGLGLSGVHGFVHNHNGHVLIASEVGAGSEFCMVLPVEHQQASATAIPVAPPKTVPQDQHILFVDDQESLATLMKQVLETRSFSVSAFTDSKAAFRHFEAEPAAFDAVVTDQNMPGLNGLELARKVSALRPGLPVVLCTGMAANVTDAELAAAGICRVFRKPLRVMDFARDLQMLLQEPVS